MRVLHLTKFPPLQGGMGTRGLHLTTELARRGHLVSVVTDSLQASPHERVPGGLEPLLSRLPAGVRTYWTESGRNRLYLHHPGGRDATTQVASVALAAAEDATPEVVLSAYLQPYGVAGHLVARELGLPHVVMHAGSDVGRLMRARDHQHLYARVLAGAAAVLTTPHHRLALVDLGIEPSRLVTLPVPLPPWAGAPYRPPAGRRVLFLGKVGRPDFVEDLLRRCDAAGLDLRIIGQPAYPQQWAEDDRGPDRLQPFVWPWQVPDELQAAAAVLAVEPSSIEIPGHLGLKAVEAAAAGRPALVPTRLTDNFRMPADAVVGTLEQLADLLAHPKRADTSGRAGYGWVAGKLAGGDPAIVSFATFTDRVEEALSTPAPTRSVPRSPETDIRLLAARPVLAVASDLAYQAPVDPDAAVCRRVPLWLSPTEGSRTTVLAGSAGVHRREFRVEEPYVRMLEAADGSVTCAALAGDDDAGWSRLHTLLSFDLLAVADPSGPPPEPPPLHRMPRRAIPGRAGPGTATERYRRQGFLVADEPLDEADATAAQVELTALLQWQPDRLTATSAALVSSWQEVDGQHRPRRVNALWNVGPALEALITANAVAGLAATAAPGVELAYLSEQLLAKWPGSESELDWHRDPGAPLGAVPELDFVVGVHFGDGTLDLLAGSHRGDIVLLTGDTTEKRHRQPVVRFIPPPLDASPTTVQLAPGLVTVHSRSVLHRSAAHRGTDPRCSVYVHFVPLEVAVSQLGRAESVRRHRALTGNVGL